MTDLSEAARAAYHRYTAACHAMQTGVAMEMNYSDEANPKHLRVGVNSALVDSSALARLLIDKGVITTEEYFEKLAECMEEERDKYQARVSERLGGGVILT